MEQQHQPLLESELSRNPSIRRLQHVLDVVLRQEFESVVKRRDAVYEKVSQQVQFRKLIKEDLKLDGGHDDDDDDDDDNGENKKKEILHDVGCRIYTRCRLVDPRVVHVNVGKDVIVAMTVDEALAHSKRAEDSYRDRGEKLTKEALSAKYKMRLVMEAIMRLQDIQIEKDVAKNRQK